MSSRSKNQPSKFGRVSKNSEEKQQPTFKERFESLKLLPGFFIEIWETSAWMILLNIFIRIIRAAIPLLTLYVAKLIIDEIIFFCKPSQSPSRFCKSLVAGWRRIRHCHLIRHFKQVSLIARRTSWRLACQQKFN